MSTVHETVPSNNLKVKLLACYAPVGIGGSDIHTNLWTDEDGNVNAVERWWKNSKGIYADDDEVIEAISMSIAFDYRSVSISLGPWEEMNGGRQMASVTFTPKDGA